MGFTSTLKFVNLGVRRRVFRRLKKPHHQWDMMRNMLDSLIKRERIETTTAKAKELQQYAEEIILHAKRDTEKSDVIVESILRTASARRKLYEELVPRYTNRDFYFTRVVNQWRFRMRDAANMSYLEFVDGPNELRPAKPTGIERTTFLWQQMQLNRKEFRKYELEARQKELLDNQNRLLPNIDKFKVQKNAMWFEGEKEKIGASNKARKDDRMVEGAHRGLEPFRVEIPPPKRRVRFDRFLRKRREG